MLNTKEVVIPVASQEVADAYSRMAPEVMMIRLGMLRIALASELTTGMRMTRKAPSARSTVKREFGLKGTGAKLFDAFDKIVTDVTGKPYSGRRPA